MEERQKEITRDLDSYISAKRKGSGLFGLFGKKSDDGEVAMHPYVKPYDDEPVATVTETKPVETPVDDAPQAEKKGFFSRWFGSEEPQEIQEPVADAPADDADLREVARIALGFLRQTDQAALAKIKSSPDFEKFKEILRRRHIIK